MSNPASEKTEKATPRRRRKAREEGQVSRSNDLNSGILLSIAFALFALLGSGMVQGLKTIVESNLSTLDISEVNVAYFIPLLTHYIFVVVKLLAPLLVSLMLVGVMCNLGQVGPLFTTKPVKPDLKKINPITGFKNKFALRGLVELIKGILKVVIIGGMAFLTIYPRRPELMGLSNADIASSLHVIFDIIFSLSWKVCIILIILGIFDYVYQKYEFEKSIRMTKQEIKDEHKNTEGNPEIKRKFKTVQMQMAQRRMMTRVPEADVVVTNPTHFAVALKYDPEIAPAPIVVAKGVDLIAKKIKEKAREHRVPVVENKLLARSLYKLAEVNQIIPEELFIAVAEVLAYIYKKNKRKQKRKLKLK
ncbi:MAG: flagellar biosynthesis protein FlhB [Cyanobacteriota bacterium]